MIDTPMVEDDLLDEAPRDDKAEAAAERAEAEALTRLHALMLSLDGHSAPTIADRLNVGSRTVQTWRAQAGLSFDSARWGAASYCCTITPGYETRAREVRQLVRAVLDDPFANPLPAWEYIRRTGAPAVGQRKRQPACLTIEPEGDQ